MTLEEAQECCKKWQVRLRMTDLVITVRGPVPEDDFDPKETVATCWWHPEYSSKGSIVLGENATEHDLVHELLHFRLEGHTDPKSKKSQRKRLDHMYERALNTLAEALTGVSE